MILIYIDTNTINARQNIIAINELEQLYEKEKILIEKTDVLDEEMAKNKGYKPGLKKSENYIESEGVFILGSSRLGHATLGDQVDDKLLTEVLIILWGKKNRNEYNQNDLADARHIATAIKYGGSFLITYEKALLEKSKELLKRFNVVEVCTPEVCLEKVKERL